MNTECAVCGKTKKRLIACIVREFEIPTCDKCYNGIVGGSIDLDFALESAKLFHKINMEEYHCEICNKPCVAKSLSSDGICGECL